MMSTTVSCSRCGSSAPGLERAPLPGLPGQQVLAQTCRACWEEWKGAQVMLINEQRLNVVNPEHYEALIREMTTFLNLHREDAHDD